MHIIKKTIIAALLAASLPALASEYFVVVPVKGKTTSSSVISVGLNPSAMPTAEVGAAYSYNFSQNLRVTGDPQ